MKTLPIITDPKSPPKILKKVAKIINPRMNDKPFTFFVYGKHFIILSESIWINKITGVAEHLFGQIEFPIDVAHWVVAGIEDKFMKGPNEGGLPAGEFKNKQDVDGETLYLVRGVCVGGPTMPGYKLVNLSRKNKYNDYQEFAMGDDFLFDYGLLDCWKDLADRHDRGEF
ncbi:hypothetical protein [Aliikangiella maris]|uniref:Uncharacterized protein n=2 Tax=Aliikangiella maris TaxID=3162458 RepID=A0ABV2BZY5_9GAMM